VAPHGKVIVVTKRAADEANTRYAQGGIAAAWTQDDSWEAHERDTLVAGAGLCRREVVARTVREAKERVNELIALGVGFDSNGGAYDLHIEGGHSSRRVLHAKDATGAEIMRALVERARAHPNIVLREEHMAIDLITEGWLARAQNDLPPTRDRVLGAYVLDTGTADVATIAARVTALHGRRRKGLPLHANPDIASGDGIAVGTARVRASRTWSSCSSPTCLFHPMRATS
jgi:L-aspartate oxidase